MFYANFKPKPLSMLGFLLRFGLNSVTFNIEKAGSPQQVTRFRSLILSIKCSYRLPSSNCVPDFHTS